jgi:hypothetical protein
MTQSVTCNHADDDAFYRQPAAISSTSYRGFDQSTGLPGSIPKNVGNSWVALGVSALMQTKNQVCGLKPPLTIVIDQVEFF